MANTVLRRKIMDGPSHVTLHVFLASDGQSGELTNFVILNPALDLNPIMPKQQDLIIKQVWYELGDFKVTFAFNSLVPYPVWTLTPGVDSMHDWRFFGGLSDYSSMPMFPDADTPAYPTSIPQAGEPDPGTGGLNSDGKLLISTSGFTDLGRSGQFVLWLEKRDRPNPQPV